MSHTRHINSTGLGLAFFCRGLFCVLLRTGHGVLSLTRRPSIQPWAILLSPWLDWWTQNWSKKGIRFLMAGGKARPSRGNALYLIPGIEREPYRNSFKKERKKQKIAKTNSVGCQHGPVGKGTYHQAWQSKFHSRDLHDRHRELTSTSVLWSPHMPTHK